MFFFLNPAGSQRIPGTTGRGVFGRGNDDESRSSIGNLYEIRSYEHAWTCKYTNVNDSLLQGIPAVYLKNPKWKQIMMSWSALVQAYCALTALLQHLVLWLSGEAGPGHTEFDGIQDSLVASNWHGVCWLKPFLLSWCQWRIILICLRRKDGNYDQIGLEYRSSHIIKWCY